MDYLDALARRTGEGSASPVENETAVALISGASRWISDMDGYFKNQGKKPLDEPSWELIAMIFTAGLIYE